MLDRTIDFYLDRAKAQIGTKSDRELARVLGYRGPIVCDFRARRVWPSDDVMVRLADLAGVDHQTALAELNVWRTAGPARQAYEKILAALVASLVVFAAWSTPAQAMNKPASGSQGLYIMENIGYVFLSKYLDSQMNPPLNYMRRMDQASGTSNSMPS